jgi:hypothetical protein
MKTINLLGFVNKNLTERQTFATVEHAKEVGERNIGFFWSKGMYYSYKILVGDEFID